MKTISRWSFRLFRWLIVITVLSLLLRRLDFLWDWAIESTEERLRGDLDFESRLFQYAYLGMKAEQLLDTVAPGAQTIDQIIGIAKDQDRIWDLLLGTLQKTAPGAGLLVGTLAEVIEETANLAGSFQDVQQLREVAAASGAFRLNPEEAQLQILGEQCGGPGAQALITLRPKIDGLAQNLQLLTENLGNDTPVSLLELNQGLQQLRSSIHRDTDTLQTIHWKVTVVSSADGILDMIPLLPRARVWARAVCDNLSLVFYLAVALLISGFAFNIGDWYERRRVRTKPPEVQVIVQPPIPAPEPENVRPTRPREPQTRPQPAQASSASSVQPAPRAPVITQPSPRAALKGSLIRRSGQASGQTISLPSQGKITLGSGTSNEIRVSGPAVSAYHAAICAARTCYFIQDLGSADGTFVNGEEITADRRLRSGDILSIGDEEFVFVKAS
jgi:hypothetical protein